MIHITDKTKNSILTCRCKKNCPPYSYVVNPDITVVLRVTCVSNCKGVGILSYKWTHESNSEKSGIRSSAVTKLRKNRAAFPNSSYRIDESVKPTQFYDIPGGTMKPGSSITVEVDVPSKLFSKKIFGISCIL